MNHYKVYTYEKEAPVEIDGYYHAYESQGKVFLINDYYGYTKAIFNGFIYVEIERDQ